MLSSDTGTTPCRVSQSVASRLDSGDSIDRQTVVMHAHDSPCGLIDVDDSVTMPAEAVVDGIADLGVSVRACDYCGGHLRVVSDNGGEPE